MVVKYRAVASDLGDKIRTGELATDARLPGELELAERYRVSRSTIRHALSTLQRDGLIETWTGAGSFVTYDAKPLDDGFSWTASLERAGVRTSTRTVGVSRREDLALAARLGLRTAFFLGIERVRFLSAGGAGRGRFGEAVSLERSLVPWRATFAGLLPPCTSGSAPVSSDSATRSVSEVMRAHGMVSVSGEEVVGVGWLDAHDASLLGHPEGAAFLRTGADQFRRRGHGHRVRGQSLAPATLPAAQHVRTTVLDVVNATRFSRVHVPPGGEARTSRVISLAGIVVDVVMVVPRLPERGGDVFCTSTFQAPGGGFSLVAAVARHGTPCLYAAPHGSGAHGDRIRSALAADGVQTLLPPRSEGDSGSCVVLVEADGERTCITAAGVEAQLHPGDLEELSVARGDVVVVSGYDLVHPESGDLLATWTGSLERDDGAVLAFDPGPLITAGPPQRLHRVLQCCDVVTMNQTEARHFAASPQLSGAQLLHAARHGCGVGEDTLVVLREGAAGSWASGGSLGSRLERTPAPVVPVVDTTGAGDTHTGVLLAGLTQGRPLTEALAAATSAASWSVTRLGPGTCPAPVERPSTTIP